MSSNVNLLVLSEELLVFDYPIGAKHSFAHFHLRVQDFAPSRFANQRHFELYLADQRDHVSVRPIFRGTFSAARPAIFVPGWIDGELIEQTDVNGDRVQPWDQEFLEGAGLEPAA